ncbi:MAG TPA: ATP-binding protein [Dermatophilaceae bacterium]|nr:ATP-binding protein [Dermatophilaceae bacterium]
MPSQDFAPPTDPEATRTARLPWGPQVVPLIRKAIVEDLQQLGIAEDVIDDSEIVVSELVANALRYAKPLTDGTVRVRWKVKAGVVEVEVSDGGGPSVPKPAPPAVWATSGRGLRIVRSVAHEWGVLEDKSGRTVWASLGGPSRRRTH